jgi:prepilin-type N-terminal cleavage/methylation domain-containing protein
MSRRTPGFTLIEVMLATAVGLVLMGASIYAYNSVKKGSSLSQARSMVGTMQTNIGMEKFRNGSPPPMTPAPASSASISTNLDSTNKPYWPGSDTPGQLPPDPITGKNQVLQYSSVASPTPLVAGAPTPQWDNPVFSSGGQYGQGGWLYDPNTGAFRINLSNQQYPEERPGNW